MKCASLSRSNASLAAPTKKAIPSSISSTGCARTNRPPFTAVAVRSANAPARSSTGRRRKPVSGMRAMQASAQAISSAPPAITAACNDWVPIKTEIPSPSSAPA